jgi:PTS system mannose-specific IIB component
MSVVLARIDDRLIHGQVTVGWTQQLRPQRILLASNQIAADAWQSRVYKSSVPPEVEVSILSIAESASFLKSSAGQDESVLLLTASPSEMAELVRLGTPVAEVNVGGLHFSSGKFEMLPFVYVDRIDVLGLRRLLDRGVHLWAQQVPGGRSFDLGVQQLLDMEARI